MVVDKRFYVDNFVGTYDITYDEQMQMDIIVSKEFNHPNSGELELKKKRIFESCLQDETDIYMKLANIDLSSRDSILGFCNKYGLPFSSQIISDKEGWIDLDINSAKAICLANGKEWKYFRNDVMTVDGFSKEVILIRKLMRLKVLLNETKPSDSWCAECISILVFFLFFSHENDYSYDINNEGFPKTRAMQIQYIFQLFYRKLNPEFLNCEPAIRVFLFLHYLQSLESQSPEISERHLMAVTGSDLFTDVLSALLPLLYGVEQNQNICHDAFSYKSYGEIHLKNQLDHVDSNMIQRLLKLGKNVFRDVINEGLRYSAPWLVFEEDGLRGGWALAYQMRGIYMELFMDTTSNFLFRQCANPTCGKYFSISKNRPNKKYCSHECASLAAKRRERQHKGDKTTGQRT